MFKLVVISIVLVPVVIGMQAARLRESWRGLLVLVAAIGVYDVLYVLNLYYLRIRWLGW
jgi:hypothetical protein